MSTRFFHIIPHDFGMKKPPVLNTMALIKVSLPCTSVVSQIRPLCFQAKIDMLESLQEIEVAYNLLKTAAAQGEDPIDAHYKSLKTELNVLDTKTEEYDYISKFVENTHGHTHTRKLKVEEVMYQITSGLLNFQSRIL